MSFIFHVWDRKAGYIKQAWVTHVTQSARDHHFKLSWRNASRIYLYHLFLSDQTISLMRWVAPLPCFRLCTLSANQPQKHTVISVLTFLIMAFLNYIFQTFHSHFKIWDSQIQVRTENTVTQYFCCGLHLFRIPSLGTPPDSLSCYRSYFWHPSVTECSVSQHYNGGRSRTIITSLLDLIKLLKYKFH